jgi:hypothetical protein
MYMTAGNDGKGVSVLPIAISIAVVVSVVAMVLFCIWYRRKRSESHVTDDQATNASPAASAREDLPLSAAQVERAAGSRVDFAAVLGRSNSSRRRQIAIYL